MNPPARWYSDSLSNCEHSAISYVLPQLFNDRSTGRPQYHMLHATDHPSAVSFMRWGKAAVRTATRTRIFQDWNQIHKRPCRPTRRPPRTTRSCTGTRTQPTRLALLCCSGMTWARPSEPQRHPLVVDAVPDPARSSDLVLPLLHFDAIDPVRAARALQRMLSAAALARLSRKRLPSRPRARRRVAAELFPSLRRSIVRVADVPPAGARRRGRRDRADVASALDDWDQNAIAVGH